MFENEKNDPYSPLYEHPDPVPNKFRTLLRELGHNILVDDRAEDRRDHWREAMDSPDASLHVDIGCGRGEYILDRAAEFPEDIHIGIDWKCKRIHFAASRAAKRSLFNTAWIRARAQRIGFIFGKSEVDSISILFPDPWPKRKQRKNRLFSSRFLHSIHPTLKKRGIILVRTDHQEYFDEIHEIFSSHDSLFRISSSKKEQKAVVSASTRFEMIFTKDNLPICELIAERI